MLKSLTIIALCLVMLAVPVVGSAPTVMNYQSYLTDGSGDPVADGSYEIIFTIYDAASGGNSKWIEGQNVTTVDGMFAILLGSINSIDDSVFSQPARFLGIKVGADPEMTPRTILVTVPWAFRTETVDGASGGAITGDIEISGKATIGPGHSNAGTNSFVAGESGTTASRNAAVGGGYGNTASADYSVVSGGSLNTASSGFASVAGGSQNQATNIKSSVGGGGQNIASGSGSHIGGGTNNDAVGTYSTVAGGTNGTADGSYSTVGGGISNNANGVSSTVSGGGNNEASGANANIGGGSTNIASDSGATVGGGVNNAASGVMAFVGGGRYNDASGEYSVVAGGGSFDIANPNLASGDWSAILGGTWNVASGHGSIVVGGSGNQAMGQFATISGGASNEVSVGSNSTIGGGYLNNVTGTYATIPGGMQNWAWGRNSFAAGYKAQAVHDGSYVWADNTGSAFQSSGENQYLIQALGGVGINTRSPTATLDVFGSIRCRFDGYEFPDGTVQTTAAVGSIPIGGVMAWLKSYSNTPALPDGYAECNGQTITDAASPYNGQATPDLNLNGGIPRFLRGGATSGSTGGSQTHAHTVTLGAEFAGVIPSPISVANNGVYPTSTSSSLPPYYAVVWIMRIK